MTRAALRPSDSGPLHCIDGGSLECGDPNDEPAPYDRDCRFALEKDGDEYWRMIGIACVPEAIVYGDEGGFAIALDEVVGSSDMRRGALKAIPDGWFDIGAGARGDRLPNERREVTWGTEDALPPGPAPPNEGEDGDDDSRAMPLEGGSGKP